MDHNNQNPYNTYADRDYRIDDMSTGMETNVSRLHDPSKGAKSDKVTVSASR
jgi:hypothetical protein